MMKKLLFALVLFSMFQVSAQETTYRQDVLKYLDINGTTEQYSGAVDQLFDLLKRQYANYNIDTKIWNKLREESAGEVGRIKAMLVSAYRNTYSQKDIKNMISFYQTDAGKLLLTDQTKMTDAHRNDASFFYNTDTGKKILNKKDEISRSVGEVSQMWSRDLYKMVVDKLAEKGYVMQQ